VDSKKIHQIKYMKEKAVVKSQYRAGTREMKACYMHNLLENTDKPWLRDDMRIEVVPAHTLHETCGHRF
jgi:hypothetical protein